MHLNPFQLSVIFHIGTCHLVCIANQMTGFYMKCNAGLKWGPKWVKASKFKSKI